MYIPIMKYSIAKMNEWYPWTIINKSQKQYWKTWYYATIYIKFKILKTTLIIGYGYIHIKSMKTFIGTTDIKFRIVDTSGEGGWGRRIWLRKETGDFNILQCFLS